MTITTEVAPEFVREIFKVNDTAGVLEGAVLEDESREECRKITPLPQPGPCVTSERLRGRRNECETLDRLLGDVRAGDSQVLVVCGEVGIGKTALLGYLSERASGCRLARAAGVESEMGLAFAGLHQLCAPFLDRLERLPAPQRASLSAAFGLSEGEVPDHFFVGLAVLSLLSDVAEEQPLVCVVDDAQWLDQPSAQALALMARRLSAKSVAVVFAMREPGYEHEFAGLRQLAVSGLNEDDACALLDSVVRGPVDERVRERIIFETRGNPLALLEFPRGLTPAELAGGFGLPDTVPLASRVEEGFLRRLKPLPMHSRRLLLAAAVEPVGDATLLWRAAEWLEIGTDAAAAAEATGLIEIGTRVRFRHPLVRSAVCRAAGVRDLQEVHRALAEASDPDLDPDRRAWHCASAASGPDEAVASALEHSAGRAQERGGLAARAAFLERATELTVEPHRRGARALAAAQAKHEAGAPDAARRLVTAAEAGPLDELQHTRVDLLRAQIALASNRPGYASPRLLKVAKRLELLDVELAREAYGDALYSTMAAGRLASGSVPEVAEAVRKAPPPLHRPCPPDLLLDSLAVLFTQGHAAGAPMLKRALGAIRSGDMSEEEGLHWLSLACRAAHDVWDDECWFELSARHVQLAREAGALRVLHVALSSHVAAQLFAGDFAAAAALVEEDEAVVAATGSEAPAYGAIGLSAWRGGDACDSELIEAMTRETFPGGEGQRLTAAQWATALHCNSLGRYEDAFAAAEQAAEYRYELGFSNWALVELVEAAVRSGKAERAANAIERLSETTGASATDWGLGILARSRALLSEGEGAEALYREAIERLDRTRMRAELARAHLLYGEWLRRENRRVDAREQLRAAHDTFSGMGAEAFAERARRELLATGETVRKRSVETRDELTAQESQIARLAGEGRTNPEIGSELFISPRTVEWHLRKVFTKLGISSRKQLRGVSTGAGRAAAPA